MKLEAPARVLKVAEEILFSYRGWKEEVGKERKGKQSINGSVFNL